MRLIHYKPTFRKNVFIKVRLPVDDQMCLIKILSMAKPFSYMVHVITTLYLLEFDISWHEAPQQFKSRASLMKKYFIQKNNNTK